MVSKVAVIALVAIVACPILLGYAMNLEEVNYTEYNENNDAVNVTPLLYTGASYSTANADIYKLNSDFTRNFDDLKTYPIYESTSSVKTSLPITMDHVDNWTGGGGATNMLQYLVYYISIDLEYSASNYVSLQVYENSTTPAAYTFNHFVYLYFDRSADILYITCKNSPTSLSTYTISEENITGLRWTITGAAVTADYGFIKSTNTSYADISAGFHFNDPAYNNGGYTVNLPERTSKVLLTVDLDSISGSSYTKVIGGITFNKTTTGGVASYTATVNWYPYSQTYDLYYDPSISDNTYQLLLDYSDNSEPSDDPSYPDPYRKYFRHFELRYVGGWPNFIGEANYYQKYTFDFAQYIQPNNSYLTGIGVSSDSLRMRVDSALFEGFQYQVIEDKTYTPSSFRSNPSTTISSIGKYGTQIIFGGNTYSVKDGNITLGTHSISVEGLVFSSSLNGSGTYDNKIGNTLISTTATPSTIQFVGKWSASVSTASMESNTYTKTEWTPGQFGWDGLDQNFLIVGLLASIGVFIALGLYVRRSRSSLWPLLLVCGGAAVLFFTML